MADQLTKQPEETTPGPEANTQTSKAPKKPARTRKAKSAGKTPSNAKGAVPSPKASDVPAKVGRKTYSDRERAQILSQIEKATNDGSTLKSAIEQAGISEQTYYVWKRAAAPAPQSDDLKDLVALEEENKRLKSLLAQRLRKENAELKKKLGLE